MKEQLNKKSILKAAAIFLVLMLAFTFLSRVSASMTVPRAAAERPAKKIIEFIVSADGKVYQNREQAILVEPNLQVDGIYVNEGQKVESGELLFTLNQASLEEAILTLTQDIEKLKLTVSDAKSQKEVPNLQKKNAGARAKEDYNNATKTGDQAVNYAAEEVNRASQRLDDFYGQSFGGPDSTELSVEEECANLQSEISSAEEELARLPGEATQEEADALGQQIQDLGEQLVQKQDALAAYRQQRAAEWEQSRGEQESQLIADLEGKKNAYEDAVNAREQGRTAASRAMEDAKLPDAQDSTGESTNMDIQLKQLELDKLHNLKNQEGKVTAPVPGVVTKLNLATGGLTAETAAITMADMTSGTRYTASVPDTEEKYLSVGQPVTLKTGTGDTVEGLKISSISANKENLDMLDVSVLMPKGELEVGMYASMTAVRQSELYPLCVPVKALHLDNKQYFVYVLQEQETVLGKEYIARRVDVSVIEKNGQFAALDPGGLTGDDRVITDSDRAVEAGGKVRLKDG